MNIEYNINVKIIKKEYTKMIKHIVMWKLKDEALGKSKKENAAIIKEKIEALTGIIDEIKYLEVGININYGDEAAYDACLITEFEDFDALNRYQVNPNHKKVSEFVKKVRLTRSVVDFEF